jgi:hypothetical protein
VICGRGSKPPHHRCSHPVGRLIESGYREGLARSVEISNPSKLIWFGDGGSGTAALWADDNWWIKSAASGYAQGNPGFNRLLQDDYGCRRHSGEANQVFAADQNDPRKRRIAHLETYTPELMGLLERILKARAARRPFAEHALARDSDFFQTNTLVKLPDDLDWKPTGSAEGRKSCPGGGRGEVQMGVRLLCACPDAFELRAPCTRELPHRALHGTAPRRKPPGVKARTSLFARAARWG